LNRFRLKQRQNPPATPDNSAAVRREEIETFGFDSFILKQALKQARKRLSKSFLARNGLVDSPERVILAG
jgi:hypothetical protein